MMLALVAAVQLAYAFPVDTPLTYTVEVSFDGYVQVFGGKNAKVDVLIATKVQGLEPAADGNPRVASEIKKIDMMMNGETMPLEPSNVTRFFPKTTITTTPYGKTVSTDAPNLKLPIRLPGLDVKRFPDITYLPIEFPAAGVEVGKPFTFKKPFGDSEVEYFVTPKEITDERVELDIAIKQSYTTFEDKFGNPVEEREGAVKVETKVEGSGRADFNRKRGLVDALLIEAKAEGKATDLKSSKVTERKLKTTLAVKLFG